MYLILHAECDDRDHDSSVEMSRWVVPDDLAQLSSQLHAVLCKGRTTRTAVAVAEGVCTWAATAVVGQTILVPDGKEHPIAVVKVGHNTLSVLNVETVEHVEVEVTSFVPPPGDPPKKKKPAPRRERARKKTQAQIDADAWAEG